MSATPRPPIVAVMGHIDHGKSSLLDYIRKSNITAGEAGGITQHVSAYEATHEYEGATRTITFLDTPGHESFKALRARGARAADIAILIVASDEGVKPQTIEAYKSIEESQLPFVVAFTKIDKPNTDVSRAQVSLLEAGIYLEGLGGNIAYTAISSKTGEGVSSLLDLVLLTADINEISGDASEKAEGFVLESSQDPKQGIRATLIIKNGTLTTGQFVVADNSYAPVRFIEDFVGGRIESAGPSKPIRISGWSAIPDAGTLFSIANSKKEAEHIVAAKAKQPTSYVQSLTDSRFTLPVIVKADVSGSLDAVAHELAKISHEDAVVRIVSASVGRVSESDVKTAVSTGGIIVAFHTDADTAAKDLAERSSIAIEQFTIIYDLAKRVDALLVERAPKVKKEEITGTIKILKVFSHTHRKFVIGARLESGEIAVGTSVRIDRRGVDLGFGKILNLQQARSDVQELRVLGEFGAQLESKEEIAPGDVLTAFIVKEV
jgi:translation initiation factor IF-2